MLTELTAESNKSTPEIKPVVFPKSKSAIIQKNSSVVFSKPSDGLSPRQSSPRSSRTKRSNNLFSPSAGFQAGGARMQVN